MRMIVELRVRVEVDADGYAKEKGFPLDEVCENFAAELLFVGDGLTWHVTDAVEEPNLGIGETDVVRTILAWPRNEPGGGIPLTRGEVAMLFLDGYAGDGPKLLDIRSQCYGEDNDWDGLTIDDVLQDEDTAFVWTKWEPLELWLNR